MSTVMTTTNKSRIVTRQELGLIPTPTGWDRLDAEQWVASCRAAVERVRCALPPRPDVTPAALKPAPPASPPARGKAARA